MEDRTHLLGFYAGTRPDDRGSLLREIHRWPDYKLEQTHDYIQWLFPLAERSGFSPEAADLGREDHSRVSVAARTPPQPADVFRRILAFYGMEIREAGQFRVTRAVSFAERSGNWITTSNHNHLRITRILKSLRLLGLEAEAVAFSLTSTARNRRRPRREFPKRLSTFGRQPRIASRLEAHRGGNGSWGRNCLPQRPRGFQNSAKGFLNPAVGWHASGNTYHRVRLDHANPHHETYFDRAVALAESVRLVIYCVNQFIGIALYNL